MSRLTGTDALGLFKAYQTVYAPQQELTEEQVWEEVEIWVNSLIEEGYDLSDYTWEEMYESYIEEASAPGVGPYKKQNLKPLPPAKPLSGEKGDGSGYGGIEKFKQDTDASSFKPGTDVPKVKKFGKIFRVIPHGIGAHKDKITSSVTKITGGDPGEPKAKKMPKAKPSREIVRKPKDTNESYDLYDVILSHLLDEGYATSVEAAKAIMVNMSEDWRESIVDEAIIRTNIPVGPGVKVGGTHLHNTETGK